MINRDSLGSDRPGLILNGKYELVEAIGQGGMAIVWRGVSHGSEGFQRPVAIKRIDPAVLGYPEVVQMFVEEARVGAALHHPNIVQVFDFGVDGEGRHFLVTELVEGLHLGAWVASHFHGARKETPWELVTAISIEVLRALDAAHSRTDSAGKLSPVLHRDVTPPNILLDLDGFVKLADFGLARAMDRGRMTRPNVVKGKVSYLAPELVLGVAPSAASDLFSLGIVMWEALTGARLFQANDDAEVVLMVRDARVPLLSVKRPGLPFAVSAAVHKALERDPARRFQSAREMLDVLKEALRVLPGSTDGQVLARSIRAARARLTQLPAAKT
jgi:serine/threonine protein kinase